MPLFPTQHYYTLKSFLSVASIIGILSLFTIGVSRVIRAFDFYYVPNTLTFGLEIPNYVLIASLLIVTGAIFYFDLYKYHLIPVVLFLTGGWGNGLEKLLFGYVTDYIPFIRGYINIADIMIWVGLIWLNLMVWFYPEPKSVQLNEQKM